MKSKFFSMLVLVCCVAVFGGIADSQTKLSTGSIVFAEWTTNGWYHGKIGGPCESGFTIKFDDGDVKCCSVNQIVADVVPVPAAVKTGIKVLALWGNGRYYPGTVGAVDGNEYNIQFDDGDKGKVTIDKIRVRN